jgi:very-short-patch-repair endonuclease
MAAETELRSPCVRGPSSTKKEPLSPCGRGGWGEGAMNQRALAKHLRSRMTESERRLWQRLRAHRLDGEKFRRQQPIGPYIVDFVHLRARLIVEADGGQHSDSPHDKLRDDWLREQGFTVLRFWNNEIMTNLDGVLETILDAVRSVPSPPAPLPQGERGDCAEVAHRSGPRTVAESPLPHGKRWDCASAL